MLSEAAREARREYKKKWNRENRDKVKAAQDRYWENRAKRESEEAQRGTQHEA